MCNFSYVIKEEMLTEEQKQGIFKEISYKTSRSGGKGGQNVNKVESKVEIDFDVLNSYVLTDELKNKILNRKTVMDQGGSIRIICEKHRSQLENKEEARKKLIHLLESILKPVKRRMATKPTKASKRKKEQSKKLNSEKKQNRRKPM